MPHQIITDRLVLRPFTAEDGARVVSLLNNFEVTKWLARVPFPFTANDLRIVGDHRESRWPDLAAITLYGEVIGGISSGDHLGYWLGQPYWGQGYATEAASAMVAHSFETQGRIDLVSGYFTGNPASGRILERLGFREVSRDMIMCRARGAEVSNVNMAINRSDWEATQ